MENKTNQTWISLRRLKPKKKKKIYIYKANKTSPQAKPDKREKNAQKKWRVNATGTCFTMDWKLSTGPVEISSKANLQQQGLQRCHALWKPRKILKSLQTNGTGPLKPLAFLCFFGIICLRNPVEPPEKKKASG